MTVTRNEKIILFSQIIDNVPMNDVNLLSNAVLLVGVPKIDARFFDTSGAQYLPKTDLLVNVYLNLYVDVGASTADRYFLNSLNAAGFYFPFGVAVDLLTPPALDPWTFNAKLTLPLFRNGSLVVASDIAKVNSLVLAAENVNTTFKNSILITI